MGGKDAAPNYSATLNPLFCFSRSSACALQLERPRFSESAGYLNIGEGEEVGRERRTEGKRETAACKGREGAEGKSLSCVSLLRESLILYIITVN